MPLNTTNVLLPILWRREYFPGDKHGAGLAEGWLGAQKPKQEASPDNPVPTELAYDEAIGPGPFADSTYYDKPIGPGAEGSGYKHKPMYEESSGGGWGPLLDAPREGSPDRMMAVSGFGGYV